MCSSENGEYDLIKHNLKIYNNYLNQCIRSAKKEFYHNEFSKYKNDIRKTWHTLKEIINYPTVHPRESVQDCQPVIVAEANTGWAQLARAVWLSVSGHQQVRLVCAGGASGPIVRQLWLLTVRLLCHQAYQWLTRIAVHYDDSGVWWFIYMGLVGQFGQPYHGLLTPDIW